MFLDESGTHIAMTPLYARAPSGQRAYGEVPRNRGSNLTLIASLTVAGMTSAMTLKGGLDTLAFDAYVQHVAYPQTRSDGGDGQPQGSLQPHGPRND